MALYTLSGQPLDAAARREAADRHQRKLALDAFKLASHMAAARAYNDSYALLCSTATALTSEDLIAFHRAARLDAGVARRAFYVRHGYTECPGTVELADGGTSACQNLVSPGYKVCRAHSA